MIVFAETFKQSRLNFLQQYLGDSRFFTFPQFRKEDAQGDTISIPSNQIGFPGADSRMERACWRTIRSALCEWTRMRINGR